MRDSAGIEILESRGPAWTPESAWRIAPTPRRKLGDAADTTDEPLYQIADLALARDGRVVIAERDGVLLTASNGTAVRRIARTGQGPGEFVALSSADVCGDAVVATDYMRSSLTLLTLGGTFAGTRALPSSVHGGSSSWIVLSCDAEWVYLRGSGPRDSGGVDSGVRSNARSVTRDSLIVVRLELNGTGADTIITVAGSESFDGLTVPFGRSTFLAVHDGRIHVVDNGVPEIRVYTPEGAAARIIRLAGMSDITVDDDDIERRRAEYADGVPRDLYDREIRPRLDAVAIPETMPFFSDLATSDDGTIWLRRYQPFRSAPVNEWIVVSAGGEWLGDVRMPDRFHPFRFSADAVLGVWRDELDVEHVHEYPIVRSPRFP